MEPATEAARVRVSSFRQRDAVHPLTLTYRGRVYKSEGAIDVSRVITAPFCAVRLIQWSLPSFNKLAFLRYGTVFHLCRDIIPSAHPDWSTCSPTVRASFDRVSTAGRRRSPSADAELRQTADSAAQQLEELKRSIRARSETFSHARAAVAKGSSPALTLRNTVLPAATSMSSTPDSDILLKKLAASQKEAKKGLFKRAFGVGKKKGGSSSPSLGTLAEPGTSETTDEERESDSPREMPNQEQQDRPLSDGRGAVIRRRPATNDRLQQQQQYPQTHQGPTRLQRRSHGPQLKLPGEEDSDEEPPAAIEYAGGSK